VELNLYSPYMPSWSGERKTYSYSERSLSQCHHHKIHKHWAGTEPGHKQSKVSMHGEYIIGFMGTQCGNSRERRDLLRRQDENPFDMNTDRLPTPPLRPERNLKRQVIVPHYRSVKPKSTVLTAVQQHITYKTSFPKNWNLIQQWTSMRNEKREAMYV
jgi:hypothetical protein